jgi:DNA polymerase III delta prime subunit
MGIETLGNPDLVHIHLDTFRRDDALELRSFGSQKSFSAGKKIFIVSTNSFLAEAQNTLLKMFEEPRENMHFFLVMPDINSLLKTVISRFFVIRLEKQKKEESADALKFLKMSPRDRVEFMKELLAEPEDDEEAGASDSVRSKALNFLNSLESALHNKIADKNFPVACFEHILKVRKYLRMPGSSAKTMMESVALIIPSF